MLSTGVSDSSDSTFLTADSSENATFAGNLIVTGNLTVSGTQTVVSSTVETHADPLIELNTGAGSNSNDLGFVFERGSTGDNAAIIWDESADVFAVGTTTATGTSTGNMSITAAGFTAGAITGTTGTFSGEVSAGTLDIGGTNITSTAAEINLLDALDRGSILYGNASGVTTVLGQGSANQVLTSDGTDIAWADASSFDADAAQVFNESGADVDFRVESDTLTHALFVEGSSGDVFLGQSSQTGYTFAQKLVVGDGDANDGITIQSGSTHQGNLAFNKAGGTTAHGRILYQQDTNYMAFMTNNSEKMRIDTQGYVGIGVTPESSAANDNSGIFVGGLGGLWGKTTAAAAKKTVLSNNVYDHPSTGETAIVTDEGAKIVLNNGTLQLTTTSAATTADAAHSFNHGLNINNKGNVGVNIVYSDYRMQINGNSTTMNDGTGACLTVNSTDNTTSMVMLGCAADINAAGIGYHRGNSRLWMTAGGGSENAATSAFTLTGAGNVGIGTNAPDHNLVVNSTGNAGIQIKAGDTSWSYLYFGEQSNAYRGIVQYNHNDDYMDFYTSGSQEMRITTTGKLAIGNTNFGYASAGLSCTGGGDSATNFVAEFKSNGNGGVVAVSSNNTAANSYTGRSTDNSVTYYVEGDGDYYFAGSSQSDRDTKENIIDVPSGSLNLVKQLRPRTFNFKTDKDNQPLRENPKTGFIAQEVAEVFGTTHGVASGEDGTGRMGIDPTGLIAHLVNAIKELEEATAKVSDITSLEQRIHDIEQRLI